MINFKKYYHEKTSRLLLYLFTIPFLLITIPNMVYAISMSGQDEVVSGSLLIGEQTIPWSDVSTTNPIYGYLYGAPGIEFANIVEDGMWDTYLSYNGSNSIEAFSDPATPKNWVDSTTLTPVAFAEKSHQDYKGIFVARFGSIYLAIDPIEIQDGYLTYNWWYDFLNPLGDVDNSKKIDVQDTILSLKVLSLSEGTDAVVVEADANSDSKIGIIDSIFILQELTK